MSGIKRSADHLSQSSTSWQLPTPTIAQIADAAAFRQAGMRRRVDPSGMPPHLPNTVVPAHLASRPSAPARLVQANHAPFRSAIPVMATIIAPPALRVPALRHPAVPAMIATHPPIVREQLHAGWDCWGAAGDAAERRGEAVLRLKAWMQAGQRDATLNLSFLSLKSLPALPPKLRFLDASFNDLTELPTLPARLKMLMVTGNEITHLPELPATLRYLYCTNNRITHLPALPAGLLRAYLDENRIVALPATLPSGLQVLDANHNALMAVPSALFTLPRHCEVRLAGNPVSDRVRHAVLPIITAPDYGGPAICLDIEEPEGDEITAPQHTPDSPPPAPVPAIVLMRGSP